MIASLLDQHPENARHGYSFWAEWVQERQRPDDAILSPWIEKLLIKKTWLHPPLGPLVTWLPLRVTAAILGWRDHLARSRPPSWGCKTSSSQIASETMNSSAMSPGQAMPAILLTNFHSHPRSRTHTNAHTFCLPVFTLHHSCCYLLFSLFGNIVFTGWNMN